MLFSIMQTEADHRSIDLVFRSETACYLMKGDIASFMGDMLWTDGLTEIKSIRFRDHSKIAAMIM